MSFRSRWAPPTRWAALTATAALMSLAGSVSAQQPMVTQQSGRGAGLVKPHFQSTNTNYKHIHVTPRPEDDEFIWHPTNTNMPNDKDAKGFEDPEVAGAASLIGGPVGGTAKSSPNEIVPKPAQMKYSAPKTFNPPSTSGPSPFAAAITHNNFEGIQFTGWIPPDTNGAMGPYNYVETTNSSFAIYDIHGNQQYSIDYNSWFGNSDFYFDPHVIYDPWGGHFIFVIDHRQDSTHGAWFTVMVSATNNALGSYWWYDFNMRLDGGTDQDQWADFPLVGYDNQALYMEGTMFQFGGGSRYQKLRVLDMAQIETAASAGWWDFWAFTTNGNYDWFTCPAEMNTYPGEAYWVTTPFYGANYLTLRRVTNPVAWASGGGGPSVSGEVISTQSYSPPPGPVQPNGAQALEGSDCRTLNAMYENGNLDIAHEIAHDWGDGLGNRSAIHWLRLDIYNHPATTLRDYFWGAAGYDYFYPSVAVNFSGDTTETFARSGGSEYPGFRESSWRSFEGSPEGSAGVRGGDGNYVRLDGSRNRWGDYSKAALDPFDFTTVWVAGEWATASNTWSTWVAETNFKPFTNVSVSTVNGAIGQTVTLSANLTRTDTNAVLSSQNIDFYVDGGYIGTTSTDGSGNAYINYAIPESGGTGNHTIYAVYQRTYSYNDSYGYGTLAVSAASTTTYVYNASGILGQTTTLYALLYRNTDFASVVSRSVDFYVSGGYVGSATTDSSGFAALNYTLPNSLGVGAKTIQVNFNGDSDYTASSGTATLQAQATTHLTVPNVSGAIGQKVNLTATLFRNDTGGKVASETVNFYVNGSFVGSGVTTTGGVAKFVYHIPESLGVGSATITASFAGDANFVASNNTATLTVTKSATTITVTNITGTHGHTVTLKATLKRSSDHAGVSGRTVTFKVGTTVVGTATTGATGIATKSYLIPSNAAIGAHPITVSFSGDADYTLSSGTGTLTVN